MVANMVCIHRYQASQRGWYVPEGTGLGYLVVEPLEVVAVPAGAAFWLCRSRGLTVLEQCAWIMQAPAEVSIKLLV